jgi:hypothetical protein
MPEGQKVTNGIVVSWVSFVVGGAILAVIVEEIMKGGKR